jgi:hypothetical protein
VEKVRMMFNIDRNQLVGCCPSLAGAVAENIFVKSKNMYPATPRVPSHALQNLLVYLEKEYCAPIERLCKMVAENIAEVPGEAHQSESSYTTLSARLAEQAVTYLSLHRQSLLPYLNDLVRKEEAGHDCRGCSVSCNEQHAAQLTAIRDAHRQLQDTMDQLRPAAASLPGETKQPDGDKSLRKDIRKLDEYLSELMYLEETAIIPTIVEAQQAIHAHS